MTNETKPPATAAPKDSEGRPPFDFAKWWDRVGILMVLIALVLLMSLIAPNFNRVDNLLNIARSISVNAILAAGLTFVILTGGIDLSVGSIIAVSGVVAVVLAIAGLPAPLAVLDGVGAVRGQAVACFVLAQAVGVGAVLHCLRVSQLSVHEMTRCDATH